MRALEKLEKSLSALQTMGLRAREEARAAGVSAYFIDNEDPTVIIEERPDGKRVRINVEHDIGTIAAE